MRVDAERDGAEPSWTEPWQDVLGWNRGAACSNPVENRPSLSLLSLVRALGEVVGRGCSSPVLEEITAGVERGVAAGLGGVCLPRCSGFSLVLRGVVSTACAGAVSLDGDVMRNLVEHFTNELRSNLLQAAIVKEALNCLQTLGVEESPGEHHKKKKSHISLILRPMEPSYEERRSKLAMRASSSQPAS
ncbi:hypothetical protein KSP40_PGU009906 [Platanthera guangdongensis]|uniref:Uncharacterized protein n=1 Tax=Platanthera guangdongensis TaxID=2320717 RepID=A0ABR2N3X8_9ASPA